ncbi:MAG: DMT family transporter [Betaproteobacteria bacterium]|nr:DMT family transporter [Betaproteobacteria bacterium]
MSSPARLWLPAIGLFGVAISLGSGHVFARLAFVNGVNILTAAAARAVGASLLVLLLLKLRKLPVLPLPREFKWTIVLGLLITSQTVLVQTAVMLLPVTLAILVFYLFPILIGLASSLLGDERFSARLAFTLIAAFGGLALVLGVDVRAVNPWGVAAGVGAAVSFAAALVLTPRVVPGLAAPVRTFYTLIVGAVILSFTLLVTQSLQLPQSANGWIGLGGLTLCYGVGIIGLFLLLLTLGPTQTGVVLNLEPVFVAMIAWLTLGEALGALQIVGGAIVVATIITYQTIGANR